MRVSFDSNAWEPVFAPEDRDYASIRAALVDRRIDGFICEAAFRIEAIRRKERAEYFAKPHMDVRFDGPVIHEGKQYSKMSFGPNDSIHPGLPDKQIKKLQRALAAGVKVMRGQNWIGLPMPLKILDINNFVSEESGAAQERMQRQLDVSALIDARSVGKAAFDAADGWTDRDRTSAEEKQLIKACAEWADGEIVAAHIAYQNDILCTDDCAGGAGTSIFNAANRSWLTTEFGVRFMTLGDLAAKVSQ